MTTNNQPPPLTAGDWAIFIPQYMWQHMPRELFNVRLAPDGDSWEASIGKLHKSNAIVGFGKTIPKALNALAKSMENMEVKHENSQQHEYDEDSVLDNFPYYIYGVVYKDTLEPIGDSYMGISKEYALSLADVVINGPQGYRGVQVMEWRFTNDITE